ncbi:MAG: copper chaperone PCu(A)C [Betaproteobacteria bacterium]|nr:copper chaperone PCu(A)C [Betaproteobacteria bacterium]MCX7195233.1 copper chaperone PCu(A)C [Pseudomonadota bacterium]
MRYIIAIAMLFCATQAWAENVVVSDASARATAPGQESAAIRFSITSKKEARLMAIVSPVAGAVEIHSMTHDNGVMKMRAIEFLPLPAGKMVKLGVSGNHVMLLNLKNPLKAGDSVPLTITVEFADKHKEKINVNAEIKSLTASSNEHEHHAH